MALQRREKSSPEIPTGSMADIVFLLLVFFLVTTTMNQDKGNWYALATGRRESKKIQKKNICNIWVNVNGDILINLEQNVPLNMLRADIEQRLAQNEKLIVSLKADEETPYEKFIDVLDEIKLSGADKISLASPSE